MKPLFTYPRLSSAALGLGLLLATPAATFAQALLPIAGSGYNVDGIADATATEANVTSVVTQLPGITFGLDGTFAYFERGFNGTAAPNGLVTGNFVSGANANTTFTIQPSAGNNALEVQNSGAAATFTLTAPARYSNLAFLTTGFNGSQPFTFTLNYTTGPSVTGNGTAGDNFNGNPYALNAGGRTGNGFTDGLGNVNPRLYEVDDAFTVDPARVLASITLRATAANTGSAGGAQAVAFFGFSGTQVVPEPSVWAMLLVGGAGLAGFLRTRHSA